MDNEIRPRLSSRTVKRLRDWYSATPVRYPGASFDDIINELLTEVGF
jgi:hypothetical protein